MTQKKKLMILGAGIYQLPLIKKAVEAGHFVITVDYLPDNIGHKYSHQYENVSTVDVPAVVAAAKRIGIDGIASFGTDVALPAISAVAEELGLNGPSSNVVDVMTDKAKFREFQMARKLSGLKYVEANNIEDLKANIAKLNFPVVTKPVKTSGSRGVIKVEENNFAILEEAFNESKSYSNSGNVCVEEYAEGIHVSGDGFLIDGEISCLVVTKKYRNGFTVLGHSLPTDISAEQQNIVKKEVEKTCCEIGYKSGPVDFDAVVSKNKVWIIEMSPRLGGNGIPEIIARSTGIDLIYELINLALDNPNSSLPECKIKTQCASMIFGSEQDGTLTSMQSFDHVREKASQVFALYSSYKPGDKVSQFKHGGHCLGYALFDLENSEGYLDMYEKIVQLININVEPNKAVI